MRIRVIWAPGLLLVCSLASACGFEPSITPIDWGTAPAAPDFQLDSRAREVQAAIDEGTMSEPSIWPSSFTTSTSAQSMGCPPMTPTWAERRHISTAPS